MTVRIYSPLFPFPPDEGNLLTVFDQACSLAMSHEVELVSWMNTEAEVRERRQRPSRVQLPPTLRWRPLTTNRGRTGGEPAWRRVWQAFLSDAASSESHYYPQWPLGVMRADPPVDLEIFHHTVAYPWLARKSRSGSRRRVCMVHDVASELYRHRAAGASTSLPRWFDSRGAGILEAHESRLAELVDELWFVSPVEMQLFQRKYGIKNGRVTSPTIHTSAAQAIRDNFRNTAHSGPPVFGVLGNLRHTPNRWSAEFIVEKVAPLLAREGFSGAIQLVGKGATDELIKAAAPYPFMSFAGFVPDLAAFWNELSGMLVPHVGGTGVRMKLLEALAYGVPVLANTDAVRRLHPDLQSSPLLTVRDEPAEWCRFLAQEKAFERRSRMAAVPIPKVLKGRELYAFVCDDYLSDR